jgi:hypothetical protein
MKVRDTLVKKRQEWEERERAAKEADAKEAFDNL